MITITTDIPLKKGVTATINWLITQDVPFPDITTESGRLAWRNFGGLLKQYGQPAKGLENSYSLDMDVGNPERQACFSYRGLDLGAITADIKTTPWGSFSWKVRRNDAPRDSEQSLLDLYVKPVILKAIEDHKEELKADAVKRLKEYVSHKLSETRDRLKKLDEEMSAALENL